MTWDVLQVQGHPDIAQVFLLSSQGRPPGHWVECVDARDPRYARAEKWCAIVSSQFGCPVGCVMCDAGADFRGSLSAEEILGQIRLVMERHRHDGGWDCPKIKIHFARMGEPSLNPAVLEVLRLLPDQYPGAALLPVVATVAPASAGRWFEELACVKREHYGGGRFQLQISVNSTDEAERDRLMPVRKWRMPDLARFGESWHAPSDRKVTLNFALAEGTPFEPAAIRALFDPDRFLVKLTPVNPTAAARETGLVSELQFEEDQALPPRLAGAVERLRAGGFTVIVSIGSAEEVAIGSNCGQMVRLRRSPKGDGD
jgi:23S rRNA (adenine2503-C2)-methyltransferase